MTIKILWESAYYIETDEYIYVPVDQNGFPLVAWPTHKPQVLLRADTQIFKDAKLKGIGND